ncbi:WISP1 protein, partial [Polyodon spathula]|nr:WISP1 protein [Polyodon spathula]
MPPVTAVTEQFNRTEYCKWPCKCPKIPPRCSAGVSLVQDGCDCCKACAKQVGEKCNEADTCDFHKGLYCDYSMDKPRYEVGVCAHVVGVGCEDNGVIYRNGQSFQPNCKYKCMCVNGAIGCMPVCRDSRPPLVWCQNPKRVKVPGKCCEQWICDESKKVRKTSPRHVSLGQYNIQHTHCLLPIDSSIMKSSCRIQPSSKDVSLVRIIKLIVLPKMDQTVIMGVLFPSLIYNTSFNRSLPTAHLDLAIFDHSSLQNCSSSVKFLGELLFFCILQMGFKVFFLSNGFLLATLPYRPDLWNADESEVWHKNCVSQTTPWSLCSKTCGTGLSMRVTNANDQCELVNERRLCNIRPCEVDITRHIKPEKKCLNVYREDEPKNLTISGCISKKTYRPKYCGVCTDNRCCIPYKSKTVEVQFECPNGALFSWPVMWINACFCNLSCKNPNDIFADLEHYYDRSEIGN